MTAMAGSSSDRGGRPGVKDCHARKKAPHGAPFACGVGRAYLKAQPLLMPIIRNTEAAGQNPVNED